MESSEDEAETEKDEQTHTTANVDPEPQPDTTNDDPESQPDIEQETVQIQDNQIDFTQAQHDDPDLGPLILYMQGKINTADTAALSNIKLEAQRPHYELLNGLLYRLLPAAKRIAVLAVPQSLQNELLTAHHQNTTAAHLSVEKMYNRMYGVYYWAGMYRDVLRFVARCHTCALHKSQHAVTNAAVSPIPLAQKPHDRVHIDIVGPFVQSILGNRYIVLMIDALTRWPEAVPVPNITAATVAACVENYITQHGAMRILISDNGAQFRSELVTQLCSIFQIKKKFTLAYNPRCNGLVERFGRTLKTSIACFVDQQQTSWDTHLSHLVFAYRSSHVHATGYTPFEMLYGRRAVTPIDAALDFSPSPYLVDADDYITRLQFALHQTWTIAQENWAVTNDRRQIYSDKQTKTQQIKPADIVYLRNESIPKGLSKKLLAKWKGPFSVLAVHGNSIRITPQGKDTPVNTVHRDRLKVSIRAAIPRR